MEHSILFLLAYCLAVSTEFVILSVLLKGVRLRNVCAISILNNTLTLPVNWFIFPSLLPDITLYVMFCEVFAVVTEAFVIVNLLEIPAKKAMLASISAKRGSYLVGLAILPLIQFA